MLPEDFPPYKTVFHYFNKWKLEGVFEELMDTLHRMVRKLMGRKEHIVFNTLCLPMSVVVHEANVQDSVGADGGYKGQKLADAVRQKLGAEFTFVPRPDESSKKFSVLPLRWIVERSFS